MLSKKYLSMIFEKKETSQNIFFAKVLQNLGEICLVLGEPHQSTLYCQRSINLYKKIPKSEMQIAKILQIIGSNYRKENNFKKADIYFKEALLKISKLNHEIKKELESEIYEQLAFLYSLTYVNQKNAYTAEKYALKSLEILNASDLFYLNPQRRKDKPLCYLAKHKLRLGEVYMRLGKYKEAMEKGFREAQYILDYNLDSCQGQMIKHQISLCVTEVLLREGNLKEVENMLTKSLDKFEKLVGGSYSLIPQTLRAEVRIRLGKFSEAYEDYLSILNLEKRDKSNYFNLTYITAFYHAAVVKYKQNDFQKSAEHFSDFFKQMREFCEGFLEESEYKDLEAKRLFFEIDLTKIPTKADMKRCLNRSTQIFSSIYGSEHPFVKDYVMKNEELQSIDMLAIF